MRPFKSAAQNIVNRIFLGRMEMVEGNYAWKGLKRIMGYFKRRDFERLMRYLRSGILDYKTPFNPYYDQRWAYKLYLAILPAELWHSEEENPYFCDINPIRLGWIKVHVWRELVFYIRLIDSEGSFDSGWWAPGVNTAYETAEEAMMRAIFFAKPPYFPHSGKRRFFQGVLALEKLRGVEGVMWIAVNVINRQLLKKAKLIPIYAEPLYKFEESNVNVKTALDMFADERQSHIDANESEKQKVKRKRKIKQPEIMERI